MLFIHNIPACNTHIHKRHQATLQIDPKSTPNRPQIDPKSIQNDPKSTQYEPKTHLFMHIPSRQKRSVTSPLNDRHCGRSLRRRVDRLRSVSLHQEASGGVGRRREA